MVDCVSERDVEVLEAVPGLIEAESHVADLTHPPRAVFFFFGRAVFAGLAARHVGGHMPLAGVISQVEGWKLGPQAWARNQWFVGG